MKTGDAAPVRELGVELADERRRPLLGARVRDTLTGYEGVAIARIEHLHGVPELKVECLRDGGLHSEWIDEARLEAVECGPAPAGFREDGR